MKNTIKFKDKQVIMNYITDDYIWSIADAIERGGFYEVQLLKFILDKYGKGGVYIDVGANIGNHALFFSRVCEAESVMCFEPSRKYFNVLLENIRDNKANNIYADKIGLCDKKVFGSMNGIFPEIDKKGDIAFGIFDDIHQHLDDVKLIKIDIEGAEVSALKGMKETIKKHKPIMVIEIHDKKDYPIITNFLGEFGYNQCTCIANKNYIYEVGA